MKGRDDVGNVVLDGNLTLKGILVGWQNLDWIQLPQMCHLAGFCKGENVIWFH